MSISVSRFLTLPSIAVNRVDLRVSPVWFLLGLLILIDAVWLMTSPLRLSKDSWWMLAELLPYLIVGIGGAYGLGRFPRLQMLGIVVTFILVAWPALRVYNHLTMSTAFPLADTMLSAGDGLLHFDWMRYVLWLDRYPLLIKLMDLTYSSLTDYSILLFLLLLVGRNPKQRCHEMLVLFFATALICSTLGMIFLAEAAAIYYSAHQDMFLNVDPQAGSYHIEHLQALRSNPHHVLVLRDLPGLVTFPSFHTAMGVIAIYCTRGKPWLLVPSLIVNLTMIASTPLFGAHYLIDVIAGAGVAIGAIILFAIFRTRQLQNKRLN